MENTHLWIIITGPHGDQKLSSGQIGDEEARRQLDLVKNDIGTPQTIDLGWLVVRGDSVVAAYTAGPRG